MKKGNSIGFPFFMLQNWHNQSVQSFNGHCEKNSEKTVKTHKNIRKNPNASFGFRM